MAQMNESVENYLETILILSKRLPVVRAIDIVAELGFSKSSVSAALKNLREKDYILIESHGYITLTGDGLALAERIYERHLWFTKWLVSLGVDEATASTDACRMEHALSSESFEAIKKSVEL